MILAVHLLKLMIWKTSKKIIKIDLTFKKIKSLKCKYSEGSDSLDRLFLFAKIDKNCTKQFAI